MPVPVVLDFNVVFVVIIIIFYFFIFFCYHLMVNKDYQYNSIQSEGCQRSIMLNDWKKKKKKKISHIPRSVAWELIPLRRFEPARVKPN